VLRNFTPTSTEEPSAADGVAGVAVFDQIVHGQPEVVAAVVKVHVTGAIALPAKSVALMVAV
jgi:hypothetical protein